VATWQYLQDDYQYSGNYSSVRRFVNKQRTAAPEVGVHTVPGAEMQVDFGSARQLYDPNSGRIRCAHVYVAALSYSRHQYAEIVFDQKSPTWIGLHQRAFESWGGVPKRIVSDNLKAVVIKALVHDPIFGEAYRRIAQHYGFVISPTQPRTPHSKGQVENRVHYIQCNFGRALVSRHPYRQPALAYLGDGTSHDPRARHDAQSAPVPVQ
jgi:transposase